MARNLVDVFRVLPDAYFEHPDKSRTPINNRLAFYRTFISRSAANNHLEKWGLAEFETHVLIDVSTTETQKEHSSRMWSEHMMPEFSRERYVEKDENGNSVTIYTRY